MKMKENRCAALSAHIIVILIAALALLSKNGVIMKMYALSQWPDMSFYTTLGLQPGVLLQIAGSVLTQFCAVPLLGGFLVLLSLAGLTLLIRKIAGDNLFSCIPALFILIFILGLDYFIYNMRSQGLLFSQTLGLCGAALIIYGWQRLSRPASAWAYMTIAVFIAYPLIGVYALAGALSVGVASVVQRKHAILTLSSSLVYCALIPVLYGSLVFTHIDSRYIYFAGLPYMDFVGDPRHFIPLGAGILSVIILPSFKQLNDRITKHRAYNIIFAAVAIACIFCLSYKDKNFHIELQMQRALEKNDWDKAFKLSAKSEYPTRVIVMYRNVALLYSGKLCDKMFSYPSESIPLNTKANLSQTEVCAIPVFFYNGLLNYCARWSWEMSMMFQRTVERYKYLAKTALLNGNEKPELVEKYLDIIDKNIFERGWVSKYRHYLNCPEALADDPEYQMIHKLSDFEENRYTDSAVAEAALNNHFLFQTDPQGLMLDLALASCMTGKQTEAFWYYYNKLLESGRRIPTHVGEAALFFAYIEQDQNLVNIVVSQLGGQNSPTVKRFVKYSEALSSMNGTEDASPAFKKAFGDTYWYYCHFIHNLTTD